MTVVFDDGTSQKYVDDIVTMLTLISSIDKVNMGIEVSEKDFESGFEFEEGEEDAKDIKQTHGWQLPLEMREESES